MQVSQIIRCAAFCLPVCTVYLLAPYHFRLQKYKKMTVMNFQGIKVVTAGGLLLFVALMALHFFNYLFLQEGFLVAWPLLLYWGGLTFLGVIDDLQGEKNCKGFRGHLLWCWQGKGISTGFYKAAGGLICGVLVSAWLGVGTWPEWFCKGAFLALFSNFFNLLDTRPARAIKLFFFLSLAFMLVYRDYILPLFSFWGALYIYLFWELEQKIMLGDAGAYLLGGFLGFYLILCLSLKGLLIIMAALLILHYLGEKFSWSELLENKKSLLFGHFPGRRN